MPKREDIDAVLIIGAGPIIIGQACEFDYSGTQACKAIREEGYKVILVNSNPATIMTDPELADRTYIEPITPEVVEKIIEKERARFPDDKLVLLPTMGGQTALNTALALERSGALEKHGVEMIGAKGDVIDKAEDRDRFKKAMDKIGLDSCKAYIAHTLEDARAALEKVGLPAIIRPSFTMGGTGGGIAYNKTEFMEIVASGLEASPTTEVLIEESVLGWKEFEMEVVRDKADNCIIICSIENIDPMGIHTGDSITVAPALTLTDKEYQIMRSASLAVLREIGVETGGSNVQFAINPENGRMIVIEMNPRVSRSSALASKATGFPIAKVAAKLAIGYTLDELDNDITGGATPASFEPTIDYVVTKIPRFAFEKFPGSKPYLTTAMKSVGEAMAIGRTFPESLQKALRSLETGLCGLDNAPFEGLGQGDDKNIIRKELATPTPDRLLKVAEALRHGVSHEQVHASCKIDPWFIHQLQLIIDMEARIKAHGLPKDAENFRAIKALGFSDKRLSQLTGLKEDKIRASRLKLDVKPVFKRIDTCAGEFASPTAYMYSSYETPTSGIPSCEAAPSDKQKIIILGSGPNRIGQGIEFDYCCCHAAFSLAKDGYETIMVNCNPETVSTDYDTSDRLYFEPLTDEDVLSIIRKEQEAGTLKGVIVQFGGQTPLKLVSTLEAENIPILGTNPDAIDLAEDRDRFKELIDKLGIAQPKNGIARTGDEAKKIADQIGFPVVIRPSYVLGGRAMEIVHNHEQLDRYINEAVVVSGDSPVLIDSYLSDAIEVDVDALSDGKDVVICGIMQHIEQAGVHSGDSACSLPPTSLSKKVIKGLKEQSTKLAKALNVVGLMNVQYAIQGDEIYILEVNPRASRTVPFVAKVKTIPVAGLASSIMGGKKIKDLKITDKPLKHIAVKEAVFPFNRFPGVDTLLGPEMRSTGEVMGIDKNFAMAFAKAQLGAGVKLPTKGKIFVSVKDSDKHAVIAPLKTLICLGFTITATSGTARFLNENDIASDTINKVLEGRPHIVDAMNNEDIQLVFNTTEGAKAVEDSKSIRQTAIKHSIPYYTTIAGIKAVAEAIKALQTETIDVRSIQAYKV